MANIAKVTNSVIDAILPTFNSTPRPNLPIWDENQKMFITSEYVSAAGNRYYKGVRFCDRLAIVEKFGFYHTWTYIDEVEVYTFNGKQAVLIGRHKFDKEFHNPELIRNETEKIVSDYVLSQSKMNNIVVDKESLKSQAKAIVDKSYQSFLSDDYSLNMNNMLPLLQD